MYQSSQRQLEVKGGGYTGNRSYRYKGREQLARGDGDIFGSLTLNNWPITYRTLGNTKKSRNSSTKSPKLSQVRAKMVGNFYSVATRQYFLLIFRYSRFAWCVVF